MTKLYESNTYRLNKRVEIRHDFTHVEKVFWIFVVFFCVVFNGQVCVASENHVLEKYERGELYLNKSDYNKALQELLAFIRAEEKLQADNRDKYQLMKAYMGVGSIYNLFSDFNSAISFYHKCLKLSRELGDETIEFKIYANLIGIYCDTKNLTRAEYYNERLLSLTKVDYGNKMAYYVLNKGYISKSRHDDRMLLKYMQQGIDTLQKYHVEGQGLSYAYSEIFQAYERNGNLKKAIYYLDEYYKESKKLGQESLIIDCYKAYMRIYTKMGNRDKALYYQNKYFQYSDSLLNVADFNQVRTEHQNYERKIMELKLKNLEQTSRFQRFVIFGVAVVLVIVFVSIVIYRRQRRRIDETNDDLFKRNEQLLDLVSSKNSSMENVGDESVSDQHHQELIKKIEMVMSDESIFCSPDFSLIQLSDMIGSNTTYVSEIINTTYHKNFRSFINEYRIRIAMKRMNDTKYDNLSIQGLAESVGFKSASNFVLAFKKVTGMTPSLYQKYVRKNKKSTDL